MGYPQLGASLLAAAPAPATLKDGSTFTLKPETAEKIAKGDRLYLSYPSGNRDDAEFEQPFSFRLDRQRNRHVGFGYGGHVCLGQHLARLEMCTLWETLLPALRSVEMSGPGQLIASEFVSGPKSVPIRYRLA